jgi:hypothetical protein
MGRVASIHELLTKTILETQGFGTLFAVFH